MSYKVLVKDGQGQELRVGNPRKAIAQAARIIGCKAADIHIINYTDRDADCLDVYLFNCRDADAQYWIDALKIGREPCYVGAPGQGE